MKDFTVKTVQQAADLAVQAGSRLYTDSASSYRAVKGYVYEVVNHTQLVPRHPGSPIAPGSSPVVRSTARR